METFAIVEICDGEVEDVWVRPTYELAKKKMQEVIESWGEVKSLSVYENSAWCEPKQYGDWNSVTIKVIRRKS